MTFTTTATRTNTYTEARLRAVMPEIGADFFSLAAATHIAVTTAEKWTASVQYLMSLEVVRSFEIQLRRPGSPPMAVIYTVSADGTIRGNDTAGGIDWFGLPDGTTASLFVNIDWDHPNAGAAATYTGSWGKGAGVTGDPARDRVYAKDGFGVSRTRIGAW